MYLNVIANWIISYSLIIVIKKMIFSLNTAKRLLITFELNYLHILLFQYSLISCETDIFTRNSNNFG